MNVKHIYYIKDEMTLESIIDFQKELYTTKPEDTQIYIHINSFGGAIAVGLKLYDLLQAYPGSLIIVGEGRLDSAATLTLFTRHKTLALTNMTCTFHGPMQTMDGKLKDNINYIKYTDEVIFPAVLDIYATKTDIFTRELLEHDNYYTAKQLEKLNILEIIDYLPIETKDE